MQDMYLSSQSYESSYEVPDGHDCLINEEGNHFNSGTCSNCAKIPQILNDVKFLKEEIEKIKNKSSIHSNKASIGFTIELKIIIPRT